jgi:hypothetical protein
MVTDQRNIKKTIVRATDGSVGVEFKRDKS